MKIGNKIKHMVIEIQSKRGNEPKKQSPRFKRRMSGRKTKDIQSDT